MTCRENRGAVLRSVLGKTAAVLASIAAVLTLGEGFNPTPQTLPPSKSYTSRRASMRAPLANTVQTGDEARLSNIARTVFEEDMRPVLLYDGVCNMCNGFVNLFLDLDKDAKFRFSALQSQTGRALLSMSGRSPDDISSIVLVEANGDAHVQSDALLRMGRLLGGFVGLVLFPSIIVPKFIRNKLYDVVADNRYSFLGKREECRCSDERYADRFI